MVMLPWKLIFKLNVEILNIGSHIYITPKRSPIASEQATSLRSDQARGICKCLVPFFVALCSLYFFYEIVPYTILCQRGVSEAENSLYEIVP
jgi:hypothetical protein